MITMRMMNPTCFKFIEAILMACLVLQVELVCAEAEVRCVERERQALLRFKSELVDKSGILSSWGSEDDNRDCCQWKGVRCSNQTGHIQWLDIHGDPYGDANLRGQIHKSLMELQQLRYLNLSFNDFSYTHNPQFLGSLSNLRYLDLYACEFVGKLPSQLGSLSNLKYLDLGGNYHLEGPIPYQLGNLSKLQYLNLGGNYYLEGSIPYQLGNLSKLQYLNLGVNHLEGSIPYQLGNLSKLQYLNLGGNYHLEGSIPYQLGNLSKLQYLNLGGNALKIDVGSQWLSNLTCLTHLDLSRVQNLNNSHHWLQMIGKLSKLRELRLSGCGLSDHFILSLSPSKFRFPISLTVLGLSGNFFKSSMIFQWLSNVSSKSNLVELYLSQNLLEGPISNHFESLAILDLSWNSFTSSMIFQWLSNVSSNLVELHLSHNLLDGLTSNYSGTSMNSLERLYLSYNTLKGEVFQWLSNVSSNLVELDLSNNLLEGPTSNHSGTSMNSLQRLDLSVNRLKGEDLKSFINICTLHSLYLYDNNFTEDLPSILHTLSAGCVGHSLQELDLRDNQIHGSLPNLSTFSSLKMLDLSENRLSGKIPEGSRLPSQLESLLIRSNSLEGGIPKSFGNTCTLDSLDMSNNSLSEELPVIIDHLSGCARYSLKKLVLDNNQICGTLPDLSIFLSLKELHLEENKLNGKIPKDIQFPSQLEILRLGSNSLEGTISDFHFANVSKLKSLDLSDNSVALAFSQKWVPSFQLDEISLRSCQLGPAFPKWLQSQNEFSFLDISNAGISDIVPTWFWAKSRLLDVRSLSLNISYNNLKGTIPNLPIRITADFLSLAWNQFEGPVPSFLRGVVILDLSKNKFSDSRSFLCDNGTVETLGRLDLSNNHLSGQIPNCWGHYQSLAYLDLSNNHFSREIPTSMGSLLELQVLLLRNNSLTGEIPFSLRNSTKLVKLDAGENRLSGPIPAWIGSRFQELQVLSLTRNHFFGSLPLQLCYLTSIQLLDLSFNKLSGRIPKCIKNFTSMAQKTSSRDSTHVFTTAAGYARDYDLNAFLMWKGAERMFMNNQLLLLKSIDLSSNQLSGAIPAEIENLSELVSLNLSRNNLTGEIPSKIGRLTSLEFLDLSRNQFFGSIPSTLSQIDRISMLDLSHNHLSGQIPISTQLQSFNATSYEDNLDLCGKPLDKLCIEGKPPPEPLGEYHEDEHLIFNHAFYVSMAFGFVIGFWGIFGSILVKRSWRHAYFKFLNNLWDRIYVMIAVKVAKRKKWLKG